MKVQDIDKLFETGKVVDLGRDVKIEVKKWGTDEVPILMEFESLPKDEKGNPKVGKDFGEFVKKVITVTLRRSIDDATDEDNLEVPLDSAMKIFEAAMEVNKDMFEVSDDDKKEFLDNVRRSQSVRHK